MIALVPKEAFTTAGNYRAVTRSTIKHAATEIAKFFQCHEGGLPTKEAEFSLQQLAKLQQQIDFAQRAKDTASKLVSALRTRRSRASMAIRYGTDKEQQTQILEIMLSGVSHTAMCDALKSVTASGVTLAAWLTAMLVVRDERMQQDKEKTFPFIHKTDCNQVLNTIWKTGSYFLPTHIY